MIGQRLSHYEVVELIGKGGMGEVYRARDARLDRDVAIKILPREMSGDAERIARFQREARTLASLTHANIATVHGFEDLPEARFLVMELVEGDDLSTRLRNGPLPVDEAIDVARQIARGLEAAHERGIVHRDLKPANVKIAPDGTVRILDFGLARAYQGDVGEDQDPAHSPTITAAMTAAGTILGTAAYMSPEQARGKAVDARADIWALGVILWEMLTGRRLFDGETISDTLAAVLRAETDLDELPASTPASVRRVLRRCLARDPRQRLRAAGDVVLELDDTEIETAAAGTAGGRTTWPWIALAVVALIAAGASWWARPTALAPAEREPLHLAVALPEGYQFVSRDRLPLGGAQPGVDISPDGRLIACIVEDERGSWLMRYDLTDGRSDVVPGTKGAFHPRFSPDGSRIAFVTGNQVKRVDATGDRVTTMAELANTFGLTWDGNDVLLVAAREANELVRIDVQRNTSETIGSVRGDEGYSWAWAVPGIDAVLVNHTSVVKSDETEADPIYFEPLDGSPRVRVGVDGTGPQLFGDDVLLAVRDGSLIGAPFDPADPGVVRTTRTVLEGLLVESTVGQWAVSPGGTLVHVPGRWLAGKSLVFDDGQGNVTDLGFPALPYGDFRLSPDGERLAITVGGADASVWIYGIERRTRRLLSTEGRAGTPVWSPDGERVAYARISSEGVETVVRTVGSASDAEVLLPLGEGGSPYVWHETAGLFVTGWGSGWNIGRIRPDDEELELEILVSTSASNWGPDVSPDGRWMAYTSDESGRYEIYVRSLGPDARTWPVSVDGGEEPLWSSDGTALFWRNGNRFMRAAVLEGRDGDTRFRTGPPEVYVEGAYSNVPGISFNVAPDDERLLLLRIEGGTERARHLNVVMNWDVELRRRMSEGDAERR